MNKEGTKIYTDQMGRQVVLAGTPKRIISLVPSQTELLFDLGLKEEIIGITKFCIHPPEIFRSKPRIGGTKQYNFEKIKTLNPDLIIGNKEENDKEQIMELMKHYPVWMSDIKCLDDALNMVSSLGEVVDKKEIAFELKNKIKEEFDKLNHEIADLKIKTKTVAYFIWKNPYMIVGNNTFIDQILTLCGFTNVFKNHTSLINRYSEVTKEEIIAAAPEVIFLSSEPYPFKEKHIQELYEILPSATIKIVDGELFSWYGSRLLLSPDYFLRLIRTI